MLKDDDDALGALEGNDDEDDERVAFGRIDEEFVVVVEFEPITVLFALCDTHTKEFSSLLEPSTNWETRLYPIVELVQTIVPLG